MISFKLGTHMFLKCVMVEIWDDDRFIASIYPSNDVHGIAIVSGRKLDVFTDSSPPNAVVVAIGEDNDGE